MLTSEQQSQVENLVIGFEISDHPIEQVFTSAKDFETPSKGTVKIYTECYVTYSIETLYDLRNYTQELISIRTIIDEDLKSLWFDFDINALYEWLKNFLEFISGLVSNLETYSEYENWEQIYPEITTELIETFTNRCFESMEVERLERNLSREIDTIISELRPHILSESTNLDIQQVIITLNALFTSCDLTETSDSEKVQIKTEPYLSTPYISDTRSFSIWVGHVSRSVSIDKKLEILFNIIKFLWDKDNFWERVNTLKPTPESLNQLEDDKKIYGAKGAYLRFLRNFLGGQNIIIENIRSNQTVDNLSEVKALLESETITRDNAEEIRDQVSEKLHVQSMSGFDFHLLPSMEISIELYKKWKEWTDISDEIKDIYEQADKGLYETPSKKRNALEELLWESKWVLDEAHWLIVRSSAVNSEDGEKTSGAWIYESIWDIHSLEEFENAIKTIFKSVDSEKAIAHRKEYKIDEEFMWLVIMPFMQTSDKYKWYANTSRAGKPNIMDVKDLNWKQASLHKDLLPVDFETGIHFGSYISQMYNLDTWSSEVGFKISNMWIAKTLPIMFIMERYFNHPMQFEFISESWRRSEGVYIVQMRPLNLAEVDSKIPEFPKEESIYEWKAIIPWDIVVNTSDLLIKWSSWEATLSSPMSNNSLLDYIWDDEYKAVIITNWFSANSGHIETLCSEKWIICICDDPLKESDYPDLSNYEKVRIVSDWEIARIYPVKNETI